MVYEIAILPRAVDEIAEAFDYYESISKSVLKAFYNELNQVYESLELNPFYQIRYKNLRAVPLKKFPYLVFFDIDTEIKKVYIYSVFNTYLNPEKYPNI